MDRRTFNKGVGAFFGALSLPFGFKSIPASVAKNPKIYYPTKECIFFRADSVPSFRISTTFDLPQVFTTGPLEMYENIEGKPDLDVDVSFWLDKDHKIERKVYFKGDNKTWSELVESPPPPYKEFGLNSVKTFEPGTENRIPLNELRLDAFYDIAVTYDSDYIITLKNFKVTNIEDFNADENDI
ncbi:MAG: hypothetical protein CL833_05070 [Crocinitomicaceae bacterium]|nr:hypothetical protein [Crocinitomicaceae bacterium]|tara:strand:- start:1319 stop:1870 length:552 start_codon:yes stop_codon:yes gene_type:complete